MQTLKERLIQYCTEHVKELPYGQHLKMIGVAVANEIKGKNMTDMVATAEEVIQVNAYPDELLVIVDDMIQLYFKDKKALFAKAGFIKKEKYFNYDIDDYKAPAFEEALRKCGMPVSQNYCQNGIAQYKIPVSNPAHLVKLGKVFQKERWIQENKSRLDRIHK